MRTPRQTSKVIQTADTDNMNHTVIPHTQLYQGPKLRITQEQVKEEESPPDFLDQETKDAGICFPLPYQKIREVVPTRRSILAGAQQNATTAQEDIANLMSERRTMNTNLSAMTSEIHDLRKDTLAARRQISDLTSEVKTLKQNLQGTNEFSHGKSLEEQQFHFAPHGNNNGGNQVHDYYPGTNGVADPSKLEGRQHRAGEHRSTGNYISDLMLEHMDPTGMWTQNTASVIEPQRTRIEMGTQPTAALHYAQRPLNQQAPQSLMYNQDVARQAEMVAFAPTQYAYNYQGNSRIKTEEPTAVPFSTPGHIGCGLTMTKGEERDITLNAGLWKMRNTDSGV